MKFATTLLLTAVIGFSLLGGALASQVEQDLFPMSNEEWMADVEEALKNSGQTDFEPFIFHRVSEYLRYYESVLGDGLVVIQLDVTDDLLPLAVGIEMNYWDKELGEAEQKQGIALMKAGLLACMEATDPAMADLHGEELAGILEEWVQEAVTRGVDMGHDEHVGEYYYSTMNDTSQRAAAFYIQRYPVYTGTYFDGMNTGVLEYEEAEIEE